MASFLARLFAPVAHAEEQESAPQEEKIEEPKVVAHSVAEVGPSA